MCPITTPSAALASTSPVQCSSAAIRDTPTAVASVNSGTAVVSDGYSSTAIVAEAVSDSSSRLFLRPGSWESGDRPGTTGTAPSQFGDQLVTFRENAVSKRRRRKSVPTRIREVEASGPCWTRTRDPLLKSSKYLTPTGSQRHLSA